MRFNCKKVSKTMLLCVMLATIAVASLSYAILLCQNSFKQTATIATVGALSIWNDSGCTVPLTAKNWGTLGASAYFNRTAYLRNDGNSVQYLGWNATGFTGRDAGFYYVGAISPSGYDFRFNIWLGNTLWGYGGTDVSLAKGAVLTVTLSLLTGASPTAGAVLNSTVTFYGYSTPTG